MHVDSFSDATIQLNMILMSSIRRALVGFPMESALFVNQKTHLGIIGINQYCIKSAPATMGMRRRVTKSRLKSSSLPASIKDPRPLSPCAISY
jgi:hypothetical protein